MKRTDVEREVELTMQSLDNLTRAKAPDELLNSLTSRMIFQKDNVRWMNRLKLGLAAMVVLAVVNTALLVNMQSEERDSLINSINTEWSLSLE